jgi:hypothetical protein
MAKNESQKTTFILGAGFSKNSGLPLQSEFANLLFADEFKSDLDQAITKILKEFLNNVFNWNEGNELPSFEDIFTCIDLSAGKNQNLGIKYDPEALRSIQKMIIYRIFSVLDRRFSYSEDITNLLHFFIKPNECNDNSNFIVLNWDIVLEKHLMRLGYGLNVDYCCNSYDWNNPIAEKRAGIPICKMHGSSNWVYCKNCKSLFFDLNSKLSLHTKAGLEKSDIRRFDRTFTKKKFYAALGITAKNRECKLCKNMPSPHIATFSYIKAFDTRMYSSIWDTAEKLLAASGHWVFIGYSFPEADYELKHLLKLAQLRFSHRRFMGKKKIDVVVFDDDKAKAKFSKFFGPNEIHFYDKGLAEYVQKVCTP